jgi:uncharacterized protein (TIGR03435 family)
MPRTVPAISVLAFVLLFHGFLYAQSASFEVASVKRNTESVRIVSGIQPETGGRLSAKAVTLRELTAYAYHVRDSLIVGGASWTASDRYDIEAKAADPAALDSALRQMLQALLSDRFQLRSHREPKELPVYLLSVAKGGSKLTKMEEKCTLGPNGFCGGYTARIGLITGQKASISQLAETLSAILDRPVLDQTGLDGLFNNVKLEWVPDETQYQTWGPQAYKRSESDPSGASLFTAIQEQLGLKLESGKGPIEVLVIDAAQKPSEN